MVRHQETDKIIIENGIYKWVKYKELQGTFIIDTEEKITDEALNCSSAKLLPCDSLLLAMYGATVGEHGILTDRGAITQNIVALKLPNITLLPLSQL